MRLVVVATRSMIWAEADDEKRSSALGVKIDPFHSEGPRRNRQTRFTKRKRRSKTLEDLGNAPDTSPTEHGDLTTPM